MITRTVNINEFKSEISAFKKFQDRTLEYIFDYYTSQSQAFEFTAMFKVEIASNWIEFDSKENLEQYLFDKYRELVNFENLDVAMLFCKSSKQWIYLLNLEQIDNLLNFINY